MYLLKKEGKAAGKAGSKADLKKLYGDIEKQAEAMYGMQESEGKPKGTPTAEEKAKALLKWGEQMAQAEAMADQERQQQKLVGQERQKEKIEFNLQKAKLKQMKEGTYEAPKKETKEISMDDILATLAEKQKKQEAAQKKKATPVKG
jgi:outer membrane protein OmpA-like peptidoglycan-associated protein